MGGSWTFESKKDGKDQESIQSRNTHEGLCSVQSLRDALRIIYDVTSH